MDSVGHRAGGLVAAALAALSIGGAWAVEAEETAAAMQAQQTGKPDTMRGAVDRRVEVWIDLSATPPAHWSTLTVEQRSRYLREVDAQQDALVERLRTWPIVELGRVRVARNAVAVEVPESALDAIRLLPDVVNVRPVSHRNRVQPERATDSPAPR
jgi:hypothetical protein